MRYYVCAFACGNESPSPSNSKACKTLTSKKATSSMRNSIQLYPFAAVFSTFIKRNTKNPASAETLVVDAGSGRFFATKAVPFESRRLLCQWQSSPKVRINQIRMMIVKTSQWQYNIIICSISIMDHQHHCHYQQQRRHHHHHHHHHHPHLRRHRHPVSLNASQHQNTQVSC